MERLMYSVMRGVGKKRPRDNDISSDDEAHDPDWDSSSDSNSTTKRPANTKTAATKRKTNTPVKKCKTGTKTAANDGKRRTKTKTAPSTNGSGSRKTTKTTANGSKRRTKTASTTVDGTGKKTKTASCDESLGALDAPEGAVSLLNLPIDVLLRIAELLTEDQGILATICALSPVSRHMRQFVCSELCHFAALWRRADLSRLGRKLSIAQLHSRALPAFPGLVSLNLEGWPALRDKDLEAICAGFGQTLAEVSLGDSDHLSGRTVTCLSEHCRQLRALSLTRLSHRLGHGQLMSQLVSRHSASLTSLTLDSLQGEIVGFGTLLELLTSGQGPTEFRLPQLTRLRLANLRASSQREAALDAAGLAVTAPNLRELELVNLNLVSCLSFTASPSFCSGFPRLRHLLVQELPNPHRLALSAAALPNLASLCIVAADFELVGGPGLRPSRLVVTHCPNADIAALTSLILPDVTAVVDVTCCPGADLSGSGAESERLLAALAGLTRALRVNLTGTNVTLTSARRVASALAGTLVELNLTSCKCLPRGLKQRLLSRQEIAGWLARSAAAAE